MGRVTRWLAAGLLLAAVTPLLLGALILTLLPATPAPDVGKYARRYEALAKDLPPE